MEKNEQITIGKIVAAVGLRGEVKVFPYSDKAEHFAPGAKLLAGDRSVRIESARFVKKLPILKFDGIEDRTGAKSLCGLSLFISARALKPLPDGEWYVRDLIGCALCDEAKGNLGVVADVRQNGAQDLYEIATPSGGTFLLPAVSAFILRVDVAEKRIVARVPDGLLELSI
ncbi:MAG: ribosome maturation factor RimM [Clostridiales Family XIII bacterium]|jgi:16S rRNA processing protein RimM|nr:ribosome maturation factor RimM [Clostridiales Family XIII bacterium]